jgi:hypothetical protein
VISSRRHLQKTTGSACFISCSPCCCITSSGSPTSC